ncbi:MAG: CHAT domain-containing protein [Bacteroidetes bacterium]|nr:CHAT domain-containing protein [Bacteroidota bacterium]
MPVQMLFEKMDLQTFQKDQVRQRINLFAIIRFPVLLLVSTILLFSCKQKNTVQPTGKSNEDTLIIAAAHWLSLYDSLAEHDIFNDRLLDSIIQLEPNLQSDTGKILLRDAYYNRGYDYDEARNYLAARNDFEKVVLLAHTIGYDRLRQETMTYNRLASIYNRLGDFSLSLNLRNQHMALAEKLQEAQLLDAAYVNLGIFFAEKGEYDSAISIFKKGIQIAKSSDYGKGKLHATLAAVFADIRKLDSASIYVKISEQLLDSFRTMDDILQWRYTNQLTKAKIADGKNEIPARNHFLQKAIALATEYSRTFRVREIGKLLLTFCRPEYIALSDERNINKALFTVCSIDTTDRFSLPKKADLYAENTIMEALDAKAEWLTRYYPTDQQNKYWQTAVNCYELAFEVERKLLLSFSYDDSRIRMLRESRRRSEKAIGLCYQLYTATNDKNWINKAFRFAERNKAVVLLESIRRNMAASRLVQNDTNIKKEQGLRFEMAFVKKNYNEAITAGDKKLVQQWDSTLKVTEQKWQFILTELSHTNERYKQSLETEDSIDISFAHRLTHARDTALLEYFVGDAVSYAFAILPGDEYRFTRIGNNNLASVDSFLYYFNDKKAILNDPKGYQQIAYKVYETWLKPSLQNFSGTKLLIITDDKLSVLPFDALITQITSGNNLQTWNYLLKKYETSYGYSVTAMLRQQQLIYNSNNIAVFAPVFASSPRGLAPLPYTKDEVAGINRSHTTVYQQEKASVAAFRKSFANAGIVHIASHARADSSGAVAQIEFADSALYLDELYALRTNASLVVLSACQTGIGKIEESEGPMSLARGFYYAGAGNIITSLWNMNDQSAATLFSNFYKHTAEAGYSADLHQAKLNYLQPGLSADKYSPYYWAGFVFIGPDHTKITITHTNRSIWLWGAIGAGALLLLLLIRAKKRAKQIV